MPDPLTFDLDAGRLAAAACCVGDDESRPYLAGVHVEPAPDGSGALIVATDGVVLAVLLDRRGHVSRPANLIIDARASRRLARSNAGLRLRAGDNDGGAFFALGEGAALAMEEVSVPAHKALVNGFANWRGVLAKMTFTTGRTRLAFDVRHLRRVRKSTRAAGGWSSHLVARASDANASGVGAILLESESVRDAFWVLMECVCTAQPAIPGWALATPGAVATAEATVPQ